MPKPTEKQRIHRLNFARMHSCTGQKRTDRRWSGWTSRRSRCFTLRTATAIYDRAWVARSSGEALLRKERLLFFLVIVLGENCQVTPAVTHAVPRSDVTAQGQVSQIVRTGTLGGVSSSFPAPTVKKVRVRTDTAKNECLDKFVTPCRSCCISVNASGQEEHFKTYPRSLSQSNQKL